MAEHKLAVPYFDGREVRLHEPPEDPARQAALARFLALGPDARARDARHVLAYWLDLRVLVDDLDGEVGPPPDDPAEVWRHVRPVGLVASADWDGHPLVILDANCDWEPEHGLMMVWRDGSTLIKVGPYDGHYDNMIWERGSDLARIVYEAGDGSRHTWRDEG